MKMTYRFLLGLVVLGAVFALGFFMGRPSNTEHDHQPGQTAAPAEKQIWYCSMDPQIQQSEPGLCPLCGMDLIIMEDSGDDLGPWELKMSQAAVKLAEVQTSPVKREFVTRELRLVGKVEYDEKRVGVIAAWAGGRVDRMFVDFTGVMINKNDHLVDLYSPELLSAQTELISAANSFRNAQRNGVNTKSTLKRVGAAREKLRLYGLTPMQVAQIEKRGTPSDQLTVYSHLEGYVLEKHVVLGKYVDKGDPLYTVADLSRVWVKLEAYEDDLPWLSYGQEVEFQTHAWPGEVFRGHIVYIDPVIDAATRTVKVRLNVNNADGRLKPDMFVRAGIFARVGSAGKVVGQGLAGKWISPMHPEVVRDEPGQCDVCGMDLVPAESLGLVDEEESEAPLVVPVTAPLITGERAVVYLADTERDGVFVGREIILGPRAGDLFVVKSGLQEGDRVVVNGNFKIDSELQIRGKFSMMYHESTVEDHDHDHALPMFEAPNSFHQSIDPLWDAFFALQKALSEDDLDGAASAAGLFRDHLPDVGSAELDAKAANFWSILEGSLEHVSGELRSAATIDLARARFEPLSAKMTELVRRYGAGRSIYRFRCPMAFDDKGADWLQDNDSLANPYFGSMMYRCGSQVEALGSASNHEPLETDEPEQELGTFDAPQSFHKSLEPAWAAYFALQKALSDDNITTAKAAAGGLSAVLARAAAGNLASDAADSWNSLSGRIKTDASDLVRAGDIDDARVLFETLSGSMLQLAQHFGTGSKTIYRFHCPMAFQNKGADWLQNNDSLANPYFGSMMYGCGEQVDTLGGN